MLYELRAENLLLMDRAELRLAPGLNVLTGETGAGKTLLAHALDLLLGGRARRGAVRQGAHEAYVEGVFALPEMHAGDLIPDGAEEVVLARRVWPDGRTRAYVCGRSATLADLQALGRRLLAFYGQHEHRKLMLSSAQLDVLDDHCGRGQLELRARVAEAHDRVHVLQKRVAELSAMAGALDRELDLLRFELDEIESVAPSDGEEAELIRERDRLRHHETLRTAAGDGVEAIASDAGGDVVEHLATAAGRLEPAVAVDSNLGAVLERIQALRYEAQDVASELRSYLAGLEESAAGTAVGLEEVEERWALLARLQRKHGGSIAEVLNHAQHCRTRLEQLEHADLELEAAEAELVQASTERDSLAGRLSAARRDLAPRLAAAVRVRLAELAMPDAEFEVRVEPRPDGCGRRGADVVELLISPNPGLPAGPLREIASGGELSRVMLALLGVAHWEGTRAPESPLLVFDEVDAGIGGHTARAVGEHLRALASRRQILCITHLPQVASLAERHFRIEKGTSAGTAITTVSELAGEGVVSELVRMLGASDGDRAASQHARRLLKAA